MLHPCLSCGACCAHFRVGFHWSETEPSLGGTVPAALTESFGPHGVAMRGTWAKQPRCIALEAEIGVRSRCTIHPNRPSVCREVQPSWESGAANPQCDRARLAHGLPVLTPEVWERIVERGAREPDQDSGCASRGFASRNARIIGTSSSCLSSST